MAANRQTDIHTHTCAQCSHASVGLAQACPNQLPGHGWLVKSLAMVRDALCMLYCLRNHLQDETTSRTWLGCSSPKSLATILNLWWERPSVSYRIAGNFCVHKFSRITNKHTRKKFRDFYFRNKVTVSDHTPSNFPHGNSDPQRVFQCQNDSKTLARLSKREQIFVS